MKSLLFALYLLLNAVLVMACASSEGPVDNAHPYADISEGFMTQEPRTYRDPKKTRPFFYKQCEQDFRDSHYSKTSYFCNER